MPIDLLNLDGISVFMDTESLAYKGLPDSAKHYSVQQHIIDTERTVKFNEKNFWRKKLSSSLLYKTFRKLMEEYWHRGANYTIIDVGANYGIFSMTLAKYIRTSNHENKIYAFDCGMASQLAGYSVKLNKLDDLVTFEQKAVSNSSSPQIVYYDPLHPEDDHIAMREFINLPSYVVEGVSLDDYFMKDYGEKFGNLIIKIDAQGVEPLIFQGMQKILHQYPPPVIFEFIPWVCKSVGQDPTAFLTSLSKSYNLYDVNEKDGYLKQISPDNISSFIKEVATNPSQHSDVFLLPRNEPIEPTLF